MSIIAILLTVLVICIVIWATRSLTAAFGVPDPIATVIMVVVILICLLWFLNRLGLNLGLT
jgi:uncharacterized membrane protein YkvI